MIDYRFLRTVDQKVFGNANANDIQFKDGDIETITGKDYARQNTVKILLTRLGQNNVFKGYGSDLQSFRHSRLTQDSLQAVLRNTIIYALSYLHAIEESEETNERIETIQTIDISFLSGDIRNLIVNLTVLLENKDSLTLFLQEVI